MGTWDTGPFDNHAARDLLRSLHAGTFDYEGFREVCDESPIGVDEAEMVIAIGALCKLPAERLPLGICPESIKVFRTPQARAWLRRRINCALDPQQSRAYALWETSGELEEWIKSVRAALP